MTAQLMALPTTAGLWTVSESRTTVGFTVSNFGRPVRGSVACASGEVQLDASGAPVRARAELDLTSLVTGIAKRDADLRKPKFLDTDRQSVMTWSADRFGRTADGGWTAEGQLCVRGATAPLTVTAVPESAALDGQWVRVRATAVLDRTAVGIRAPTILIGRTIGITIDAWLTPVRP